VNGGLTFRKGGASARPVRQIERGAADYHTEIEQGAFQPSKPVPGIGPSPDRTLLARLFSCGDAYRARLGVNYQQIPVNAPIAPVNTYGKDRAGSTRRFFPSMVLARRCGRLPAAARCRSILMSR
jgi:catalase